MDSRVAESWSWLLPNPKRVEAHTLRRLRCFLPTSRSQKEKNMSNGPTPTQIKQVQSNLTNMQAFNDYVYNQGQSRVLNAYLLLSEQDSSDPGLTIGLNILQ